MEEQSSLTSTLMVTMALRISLLGLTEPRERQRVARKLLGLGAKLEIAKNVPTHAPETGIVRTEERLQETRDRSTGY